MRPQPLGAKALSILTVSDHLLTGETLSAEEREAISCWIWRNLHFHSRRKRRTEESYD